MTWGRKTGGRVRGVSFNKPKIKQIKLDDTEENRELVAMAQLMRTPKAVMLDAMMEFETIGKHSEVGNRYVATQVHGVARQRHIGPGCLRRTRSSR